MRCADPDCPYCKGRGACTHHYRVRLPAGLFFALRERHGNVAARIRDLMERDLHESLMRERADATGPRSP